MRQTGVCGEDADVLGEERSGTSRHGVEVEAAPADDVGSEATTTSDCEDLGDGCLIEAALGGDVEDLCG